MVAIADRVWRQAGVNCFRDCVCGGRDKKGNLCAANQKDSPSQRHYIGRSMHRSIVNWPINQNHSIHGLAALGKGFHTFD